MTENTINSQGPTVDQSLWEYVPVREYKLPATAITQTVKGGFSGLWRKLRLTGKLSEDVLNIEKNLEALPQPLLEQIAPHPDWASAAISLKSFLSEWIKGPQKTGQAIAVVGQSHSGNPKILTQLAEDLGWRLIDPPTVAQILSVGVQPGKSRRGPDFVASGIEKYA